MQIQTTCPQCGKNYDIDDKYEGAEVQCESCGRQFAAMRIAPNRRAVGRKGRLPTSFCTLTWLAFFAIQGVGYLIATVINMTIDAVLINLMVDMSIGFDILKLMITLVFTGAASYCAFCLVAMRMIVKRCKGE
ncbi:MAG: zinc-ribbon domain-containing protein [Kiritimatiellae bacterium]|nr:zinc-ribbon domain-containing protein [Kiritimatiellia bacterium]